jgi:hypothetical protein
VDEVKRRRAQRSTPLLLLPLPRPAHSIMAPYTDDPRRVDEVVNPIKLSAAADSTSITGEPPTSPSLSPSHSRPARAQIAWEWSVCSLVPSVCSRGALNPVDEAEELGWDGMADEVVRCCRVPMWAWVAMFCAVSSVMGAKTLVRAKVDNSNTYSGEYPPSSLPPSWTGR